MKSCYDCIHCEACSDAGDAGISCLKVDASKCKHFRNKADFVEVKHGRWERGFCSECGKLNPTTDLNEFTMKWFSRYLPRCPYCGAKMDAVNYESSKRMEGENENH